MVSRFTYSEEEMKALMLNLYPRILRYIQHKLGSTWKHCAEDVFFDVLCRFLEKKPELDPRNVPGYIFMGVRNACVNFLSRNAVETRSVSLSSLTEDAWEKLYEAEFLSSESEKKEEDGHQPGISEVMRFSETLPPKTREVFLKSRIEGKKQSEIAQEMGITERTVRKHLNISVQKFRKHFR